MADDSRQLEYFIKYISDTQGAAAAKTALDGLNRQHVALSNSGEISFRTQQRLANSFVHLGGAVGPVGNFLHTYEYAAHMAEQRHMSMLALFSNIAPLIGVGAAIAAVTRAWQAAGEHAKEYNDIAKEVGAHSTMSTGQAFGDLFAGSPALQTAKQAKVDLEIYTNLLTPPGEEERVAKQLKKIQAELLDKIHAASPGGGETGPAMFSREWFAEQYASARRGLKDLGPSGAPEMQYQQPGESDEAFKRRQENQQKIMQAQFEAGTKSQQVILDRAKLHNETEPEQKRKDEIDLLANEARARIAIAMEGGETPKGADQFIVAHADEAKLTHEHAAGLKERAELDQAHRNRVQRDKEYELKSDAEGAKFEEDELKNNSELEARNRKDAIEGQRAIAEDKKSTEAQRKAALLEIARLEKEAAEGPGARKLIDLKAREAIDRLRGVFAPPAMEMHTDRLARIGSYSGGPNAAVALLASMNLHLAAVHVTMTGRGINVAKIPNQSARVR